MLKVEKLNVSIKMTKGLYPVLENLSFSVERGDTLGIVGESGCGKSMTAMTLMGLLRKNIKIVSGQINFDGMDLAAFSQKQYEQIRGKRLSMIFQDSMSSLNPLIKAGKQIGEAYQIHFGLSGDALDSKILESLSSVGFTNPEETRNKYPHQLSGGQRQRVMIAMAIAGNPELLIADEPTTALDVTSQNKILTLIKNIQSASGLAIIIISHDITVISQTCSHVCVMYSGWIVEHGRVKDIIGNPKHPYTKALIAAIPNDKAKDQELEVIKGSVPSLLQRPKEGCVFAERCKYRMPECSGEIGNFVLDDGRTVRCILYRYKDGGKEQ
ncbi:ABC transporter ATP-binding protein [Spirochaetota bacterium]